MIRYHLVLQLAPVERGDALVSTAGPGDIFFFFF